MVTQEQIRDTVARVRCSFERHWRWALAAGAAVLLLTLVGIFVMPRSYYSEARLFVRFGRDNLVLDPTASNGQLISIYESRESEINSLIEVLKSHGLLDKLVERLGPSYILTGRPLKKDVAAGDKPKTAADRLATPQVIQPSKAHQQAILHLERSLEIYAPRKSNIISVRCKAGSPQVAQQIVATLVDLYLDEHVRVHHTPGSYEFFQDQTRVTKIEWQNAAGHLRKMKDELGVVTIEGKKKLLQDEIGDIETKMLANAAELKTAEAKIDSLESLIAGLPERIMTQEAQSPNAAFDNMRGTLFQLESREQELAARMQDNHPQLMAVRQQLADLRNLIGEQSPQRMQATHAVNPSRQALELALLTERSQADALRGRGASLAQLNERLQQDLRALNRHEVSLAQMQQEVDLAESRHKAYADKLEQARINRSLDEERISSLNIVQPASYASKPSGPRRAYVLAAGLLVAILASAGVIAAGIWLQPMLASRLDIERLLDLPLVGIVPAQATLASAA